MKTSIRRSKSARKARSASQAALGRYLAAGLGATGLASVDSEAAIVTIDITNIGSNNQNISGANAGMALNDPIKAIDNFPISGTGFRLFNQDYVAYNGTLVNKGFNRNFSFDSGQNFQVATGGGVASPFRFTEAGTSSVGPTLPGGTTWNTNSQRWWFAYQYDAASVPLTKAPDWGAGSYLGFRGRPNSTSNDWTYGYFEVTWNSTTENFQILSGAYESTPNTPIAVPEPTGVALAGIGALALGAGAIRRSRKARKAAAEGTLAEAV